MQFQLSLFGKAGLLAGRGLGAVGHGHHVLAGLLGVAGLLGDHGNTTILRGLDTDSLEIQVRILRVNGSST